MLLQLTRAENRKAGQVEEQEIEIVNKEQLVNLLSEIKDDFNSVIFLGVKSEEEEEEEEEEEANPDEPENFITINVYLGTYAVSVRLNDKQFYLVGDEKQEGVADIILGGQGIDYPKKYLATFEQALSAFLEFFEERSINRGIWRKW